MTHTNTAMLPANTARSIHVAHSGTPVPAGFRTEFNNAPTLPIIDTSLSTALQHQRVIEVQNIVSTFNCVR